jgi:6-phosphogluconate dehydrogenase
MRAVGEELGWKLNFGEIAMIWRGGCIIRARFLQRIKEAFDKNSALPNLLLDPYFKDILERTQQNWRTIISKAALAGVPIPAFAASLGYFDSPQRAAASESASGSARLFRRSHLRARGSAAG